MKPRKVFAVLVLASVSLFGCAAANQPKVGQANLTITTVISDAGTIAIQAEQQYQAGTIPQTAAARTAINDLGAAYEDAKKVYSVFLAAYAEYGTAQQKQIQACAPAGAGTTQSTDACQTITAVATAAQTKLTTAQASLNTSLSALTAKTNAVKAITPK